MTVGNVLNSGSDNKLEMKRGLDMGASQIFKFVVRREARCNEVVM